MNEQGCSELTADINGRIADRLVGLENIILPEHINRVTEQTGKRNNQGCGLTHEVMMWVVLAMGICTEPPIRRVFKACRRLRHGEHSQTRSTLCMARRRLGSEPLVALHKLVVRPMATAKTIGAFYRGLRKVAIDGTVLMSNLLDADEFPGKTTVMQYHERSEEELMFDEQKTHQDPCRTKKKKASGSRSYLSQAQA